MRVTSRRPTGLHECLLRTRTDWLDAPLVTCLPLQDNVVNAYLARVRAEVARHHVVQTHVFSTFFLTRLMDPKPPPVRSTLATLLARLNYANVQKCAPCTRQAAASWRVVLNAYLASVRATYSLVSFMRCQLVMHDGHVA